MGEILTVLKEIISKLTLSFSCAPKPKPKDTREPDKGQNINVYVNNYGRDNAKKVGGIDILSSLDNIYAHEVKEIAIKVEFADGTPASCVEVEFYVENLYSPKRKSTDKNGVVSFQDICFKEAGNYHFRVAAAGEFVYNDFIAVKDNMIELKFISQPQDAASKEVLNEIAVQAVYQSGAAAKNVLITLAINKEGVRWKGTKGHITDKDGIARFDDFVFTRTGNYKLQAICKTVSLYSEPFHIFAPGVCVDFTKYDPGSEEETSAFLTALLEKQSDGDIIKYNGEEY